MNSQHALRPGDEAEREDWAELTARVLASLYADVDAPELLEAMIRNEFPGRIAVVSSFGADSALLLEMVAAIDASTPVIFLDTRKHFGETLRYRNRLVARLGLTDVRSVRPDASRIATRDPDGVLWQSDAEACCRLRKVQPLQDALEDFDAWVTGRRRYQTVARAGLPTIEAADGRIKINPLARLSAKEVEDWRGATDLPVHPLIDDGFLSIGCMPCTDRVADGENGRAGRWRGDSKTECGIHISGSKE